MPTLYTEISRKYTLGQKNAKGTLSAPYGNFHSWKETIKSKRAHKAGNEKIEDKKGRRRANCSQATEPLPRDWAHSPESLLPAYYCRRRKDRPQHPTGSPQEIRYQRLTRYAQACSTSDQSGPTQGHSQAYTCTEHPLFQRLLAGKDLQIGLLAAARDNGYFLLVYPVRTERPYTYWL